jgi:thioredoxin reductase
VDLTQRATVQAPLPFETSHPGLFAVGDLRSGSTKLAKCFISKRCH